jgi:hypothetical protein
LPGEFRAVRAKERRRVREKFESNEMVERVPAGEERIACINSQ